MLDNLDQHLKIEEFATEKAAMAAALDASVIKQKQQEIKNYQAEVAAQEGILGLKELQDLPTKIIDVVEAEAKVETIESQREEAIENKALFDSQIHSLTTSKETITNLSEEIADLEQSYRTVNKLYNSFKGDIPNITNIALDTYYVAAELEAVLAAANQTLAKMTNNRYTLKHSVKGLGKSDAAAGLEIQVLDEHTGKPRDPHSLSGGETFLSSLALALGLAEIVSSRAGGIELNTLFIDEGFGSLSPEFLEMAMQTLDSLKQGGRTIGVISHVESMKERIAAQVRVERRIGSSSEILHAK